MEHQDERQARNEALYREVNERVALLDKQAHEGWARDDELFEFRCECGRPGGCDGRVRMTIGEYDRVRAQDDRFALVPGHETEDIETVVERSDRYVVVDKVRDLESITADDPRGAPSS